MREILFKAKRIEDDKWIEGFYCSIRETTYCIKEDYDRNPVPTHHCIAVDEMTDWGLPNKLRLYEVGPETICQFTGLFDKNGKKIWENDILMAHLDESYPENVTYETVEWNIAGWVGRETDSIGRQYLDKFDLEHYEVVGNIFDNPELLQEEHK